MKYQAFIVAFGTASIFIPPQSGVVHSIIIFCTVINAINLGRKIGA